MSLEAISDLYMLRRKTRETVNQLFLHCEFSSFLWCQVICQSGLLWCSPKSVPGMIEAWRMVPFSGCSLVLWRIIPFAILWSVLEKEVC